jgi:feruloyl esterase
MGCYAMEAFTSNRLRTFALERVEMKIRYWLAFLAVNVMFGLPLLAVTCESLAGLSLLQCHITSAKPFNAGTFVAEGTKPLEGLPAFCRVEATLIPTPDSDIKIEVWMPSSGWNGKYEGTGNGGYAGNIYYGALADGVRRGYAVANTDMGTALRLVGDGDGLIGHPERWADWGWRATHEMTVAAKRIVEAYYGHAPKRSYFWGCSTGGEQALMEAQRFPDDYDGIAAGAPANDRTHLHVDILWNFVAGASNPGDYIPEAKLSLLTHAVLNACPAAKATPADAFLSYPGNCHWNPADLVCKSGDAPDCLTAEQVNTAKKFYGGPRNSVTHEAIYPGEERGSEFGWAGAMPQTGWPPYDILFKWVAGPEWNWRDFDFNRDVAAVDARLAPMLNATNPDLSAFKAHGHKLLMYHGWADWLIPPEGSTNYLKSVVDAQAAEGRNSNREEETGAFLRLFMVPGMAHCGDGPGLTTLDPLPSLELWVEKGVAPEEMVASRVEKGATVLTRPVCPYPKIGKYKGTGDTSSAASFTCANQRLQSAR